ncbi:MAG: dihydroorotase [Gammaproteobacteria bacterium]|nr:MAG: dihydroorotase [Gammaproteobacteria bacterium]
MAELMNIHIRGGRVIDPANNIDSVKDLYIANGNIIALGDMPDGFTADKTIDAVNQIVCPGLVDLSARMREPGQEYKATLKSECAAAIAGGITTSCCPPDTTPIIDTPAMANMLTHRGREIGLTHILPLGALTNALDGETLSDMHALHQAGCVAFSNAEHAITNTMVMRRAMEYASSFDLLLILHANDPWLSDNGCMHEGEISTRLGLAGIPEAAETIIVARDLALIEQTGVRAHFARLSCARSVDLIVQARDRGLKVTADVAIHHLHLTEYDVTDFNTLCRVMPPLRSERDKDSLRSAVGQGDIQAICSDHQPHERDAKLAAFSEAESGISGLETLLPLGLKLVHEDVMGLNTLIASLSSGPAALLGIEAGSLGIGRQADICIFDPDEEWLVDSAKLLSKGRNTPFKHWPLKGRVSTTLLAGSIAYSRT